MAKGFSIKISRIGESEVSACQRRCQEALDLLNKGDFERVAELLSEIEKENLYPDKSALTSVAYQISLACIRSKADMAWHQLAQQEADQRVHELQKQLTIILSLIIQPESPQELSTPEEIPGPNPIPMPLIVTQTLERQKRPRFWQRVRALLDSISPPLADERAILTTDIVDSRLQETLLTKSEVEEPTSPLLESENKSDLVEAQAQEAAYPSISQVEEPTSSLPESERKSEQSSSSLVIYCLGPFRVYQRDKEITEWHSFKGRDILKYLLVHRETPVAKDILIDVFWPEADPRAARRNLHQTIYSLRQTLRGEQPEFHYIWFENDCYFLNPQMDIWLDFIEFEKNIQEGQRLEKAGRVEEAIKRYETAEQLYQGDFLQEDLYEDWPILQRENLRNHYLSAAERLSELYIHNQQYAAVVPICTKVLAMDRTQEAAHRQLIQCYLAQGLRHLAVRQYRICDRALREELGISPSEETVALYERILSQS